MRKFFAILLIMATILLSCTACIQGSVGSNGEVSLPTITEPFLKLKDEAQCKNCSIKMSTNLAPAVSYYITPSGFEWDRLEAKGYRMEIKVAYDVYYEKDWAIGIGYAGSPKYEISIVNSDGLGNMESNMTTNTKTQTRTMSLVYNIVDIKNQRIVLTFSTDNIQNIIYFKNIKVTYKCAK